eukprot:364403-Chlamydomonas_euryale.AAC.8
MSPAAFLSASSPRSTDLLTSPHQTNALWAAAAAADDAAACRSFSAPQFLLSKRTLTYSGARPFHRLPPLPFPSKSIPGGSCSPSPLHIVLSQLPHQRTSGSSSCCCSMKPRTSNAPSPPSPAFFPIIPFSVMIPVISDAGATSNEGFHTCEGHGVQVRDVGLKCGVEGCVAVRRGERGTWRERRRGKHGGRGG